MLCVQFCSYDVYVGANIHLNCNPVQMVIISRKDFNLFLPVRIVAVSVQEMSHY